jgi:thiol-disulfide isomerase/thioredoxin
MRSVSKNAARLAVIALGLGASLGVARAQKLEGRWTATIVQGGVTIPFRIDISGDGDRLVGTLYNGQEKEYTSSARIDNGKVELNFEHYLTSIEATLKDGELNGRLISRRAGPAAEESAADAPRTNRRTEYAKGTSSASNAVEAAPDRSAGSPFHAKRYFALSQSAAANVPSIDGVWEIPHESPKGERSWRLIVQQKGADILASVLRVDGDTGGLTGTWQDGKFVASHFDGARPGLIELTPQADGTLSVNLNAAPRIGVLTAYRPEVARAKGLPEPSNYQTHTTVRDPNEIFAYSFPDIHGKLVSNEDPKFKGKVVLAIVTGTWCPNCHDEAQYLVELYAKYHSQGLEIVALDFEEPEQQSTLQRVNAFIKQYKVPYTYLIAGAPSEMWDKVPQTVNLNTWPATLFIGKDGKVKATHSGFASRASGIYNDELRAEFTANIERLLKEQQGGAQTETAVAVAR